MPVSRFAVCSAVVLIACDSPAAPPARNVGIPDYRADVGVVRTKTNVVYESDLFAENTCNGDVVTLQGKSHQVFTLIDTGDQLYVTVHSNLADAKGYGVPSGARYVLNNAQTERAVVVEFPEFIFEDNIKVNSELVSQGTEPNMILHYTVAVSIVDNELTLTYPKYSLECRG